MLLGSSHDTLRRRQEMRNGGTGQVPNRQEVVGNRPSAQINKKS
ncbi:MAG: hypothetical protein RBU37_05685 [Myxococcota bacterium]|nr:hypothetical protein [Myxococcota bacterium]